MISKLLMGSGGPTGVVVPDCMKLAVSVQILCIICNDLWNWDFTVHVVMLSVSSSRRGHWPGFFRT